MVVHTAPNRIHTVKGPKTSLRYIRGTGTISVPSDKGQSIKGRGDVALLIKSCTPALSLYVGP